jgi:hypothetical protein
MDSDRYGKQFCLSLVQDGVMEYESIANPVWANASRTMISIDIVFPSLGPNPVKFNASPSDVMSYGREIYQAIVSGKYGSIAEPISQE